MRQLIIIATCLFVTPAFAVNKCITSSGKIVFQDTHCDSDSKSSEKVKVWNQQTGPTRARDVEPNTSLEGPPQAKPLLDLYRRWADAEKLALSTGRIALAGPVAAMQAIQREVEGMSPPSCLSEAHSILTALAKKSTEGLIKFMGKDELGSMVYNVVDRRKLVPAFEQSIAKARCD